MNKKDLFIGLDYAVALREVSWHTRHAAYDTKVYRGTVLDLSYEKVVPVKKLYYNLTQKKWFVEQKSEIQRGILVHLDKPVEITTPRYRKDGYRWPGSDQDGCPEDWDALDTVVTHEVILPSGKCFKCPWHEHAAEVRWKDISERSNAKQHNARIAAVAENTPKLKRLTEYVAAEFPRRFGLEPGVMSQVNRDTEYLHFGAAQFGIEFKTQWLNKYETNRGAQGVTVSMPVEVLARLLGSLSAADYVPTEDLISKILNSDPEWLALQEERKNLHG